ncbi:hypothetical protein HN011_011758 [Eciton burchellii]|nr:hypothetical protein HN011_011758 [Eciton burchellii]
MRLVSAASHGTRDYTKTHASSRLYVGNEWLALVNRISKGYILRRPTKKPRPHPGSRCPLQRQERIRSRHNASNLSLYRDIIQL